MPDPSNSAALPATSVQPPLDAAIAPGAWALVTGAADRGGAAIARALHARGMAVVIHHTGRSGDAAEALHRDFESARAGSARCWVADFARADFSVPGWLAGLGVAVLVCNASVYRPSGLGDVERRVEDRAVHLDANIALLEALHPGRADAALRSVVAITDIGVERAPVGHLGYTVAKGALQTLILALANEWAPRVRLNVVQPGTLPFPVDWDDPERTRRILAGIPLGRTGTFEELAAVVAFLALDASYVTGQVLAVDGGRSRRAD